MLEDEKLHHLDPGLYFYVVYYRHGLSKYRIIGKTMHTAEQDGTSSTGIFADTTPPVVDYYVDKHQHIYANAYMIENSEVVILDEDMLDPVLNKRDAPELLVYEIFDLAEENMSVMTEVYEKLTRLRVEQLKKRSESNVVTFAKIS